MSVLSPKMMGIVAFLVIVSIVTVGCTVVTAGELPSGAVEVEVMAVEPIAEGAPMPEGGEELPMAGSGPDLAMRPSAEWMELEEGTYHWYAFKFDYDDGYKEPLEIKLFSEPKDGAILTIRNAEQAELWRNEGKHEHVGCCVVQELNADDETKYAVWAGDLDSSGTYYIVVEHAKNLTGPAAYRFELGGEGISMPAELYEPMVMTPTIPLPPPEPKMMVMEAGSGPDLAMALTEDWMSLESGQQQWFAFGYDFDEGYKQPLEIKLFSEPKDGAILTIRNAEQAELWRNEGENEHIGCCTVQALDADTDTKFAVWSGNLDSSGIYYIVVEHAKNLTEPVNYRFEIGGEGYYLLEGLMDPVAATPIEIPKPIPEAVEETMVSNLFGTGPDFAMVPHDAWMDLEEGQYHWYAFKFDYDKDYKGPVEIQLFTEPKDSAILTVRNAEQAELWRQEGKNEHLGCCTVQALNDDTDTKFAVWSGKLDSSGTYYIVVEHAKDVSGTANYHFTVSGEGVSF